MARNIFRLGTRLTSISTAITIAQLVAASTVETVVRDISVSFDGTVVTNAPTDVQILFQTSGTGTSGATTPAPTKVDARTGVAIIATAAYSFSVEPTAGNEIFRWHVHPQSGYTWQGTPYMDEIVNEANATATRNMGIKFATAPAASIDCDVYIVAEE